MTLVRSCVLPGSQHAELEAGAYACPTCQTRLVRQLGEIETYLTIVTAVPSRSGDFGPHRPGFASSPPARLDVIAMLDPRTEINGPAPDDVLDEIPNIHADLFGWLRMLVAGHPGFGPNPHPQYRHWTVPETLADGVTALRVCNTWLVCQPWVDEFAADIARVHGALRRACGDTPPKSLGVCLDEACGGQVHRRSGDPRDARLQCGTCRTTYDGFDLLKIRSENV